MMIPLIRVLYVFTTKIRILLICSSFLYPGIVPHLKLNLRVLIFNYKFKQCTVLFPKGNVARVLKGSAGDMKIWRIERFFNFPVHRNYLNFKEVHNIVLLQMDWSKCPRLTSWWLSLKFYFPTLRWRNKDCYKKFPTKGIIFYLYIIFVFYF